MATPKGSLDYHDTAMYRARSVDMVSKWAILTVYCAVFRIV